MVRAERRARKAQLIAQLRLATSRLQFDITKAGAVQVAAWKVACSEAKAVVAQRRPRERRMASALALLNECKTASPVRLAKIAYGSDA
ncbi:MAG: hypothetical protein HY856_13345 [Burkholderiales bacterium]|nr:hypothetical protein [Burkholderiales bacterium]